MKNKLIFAIGSMLIIDFALALGLFLLVPTPASSTELCPAGWDKTFKSSTKVFMPTLLKSQWKLVKAQALTESGCRPKVCSHVGACGVLQIMPGTWDDIQRSLSGKSPAWAKIVHDIRGLPGKAPDRKTSIFDPKLNIIYGAKYMGWLCGQWSGRGRKAEETFDLCAASFNSGIGHIVKAQTLCGGPKLWRDISKCLVNVTGKHSKETLQYIERIHAWRKRLN